MLLGPHTENCAAAADKLLAGGAARRVPDADALARELGELARDPRAAEARGRAAHAVAARASAAARDTVEFLRERGVIPR